MNYLVVEQALTQIVFCIGSLVVTIYYFILIETLEGFMNKFYSSRAGTILTFIGLTANLITLVFDYEHFPLSDLSESLLVISWLCLLFPLYFFFKDEDVILKGITLLIGIFTQGFATFTQGFATFGLLMEMGKPTTLVPALQSVWLIMHVTTIIFAYAALLCGSLLAVAFIVFDERETIPYYIDYFSERRYHPDQIYLSIKILFSSYCRKTKKFFKTLLDRNRDIDWFKSDTFKKIIKKYPLSKRRELRGEYNLMYVRVDLWSFYFIRFGFFCLSIGIISGAVWANESWGSYWSWDPKEIFALITWIIFGIYLHIRTNKPNPDRKFCAQLAALGFLVLFICYFGLNLFTTGFHTYGRMK